MKDTRVLIDDILESIRKIERYVGHTSAAEFLADGEMQDAVIRRLAIIGEAAKNFPSALQQKYPPVPWKKIAGMRNILIHEYSEVDAQRVWDTIQKDIPDLRKKMEEIRHGIVDSK